MKRLRKIGCLLLALGIMLAGPVSCTQDSPLTPDDIYAFLEGEDGAKVTITVKMNGIAATAVVMEIQGNVAKLTTKVKVNDQRAETVTYVEADGDEEYLWTKGSDRKWKRKLITDPADTESVQKYMELFNSNNYGAYDEEAGRYYMLPDVEIELNGTTYSDGYISIIEDEYGDVTYELYTYITGEVEGVMLSGSMSFKISQIGNVTVTLPTEGSSR